IFGRAMTARASVDVGAVIAAYDFTRFRRIADIGGGRGHLLRAILEAAPGAEGILFDLPMVIDTLTAGDQPRLTLHAGDFFVDPAGARRDRRNPDRAVPESRPAPPGRPGVVARSVPLVGDAQGNAHRDRPA